MTELALSIGVNLVLGIFLFALLYRKRAGDEVRLSGPSEAVDIFQQYFPDAVGTATVATDRRSALIDLQRGAGIGLLQRHGRRWNARVLAPGELSSVRVVGDDAVHIKFSDFGWPRACIHIADADARAKWLGRLNSLMAPASSRQRADLRHA
jgi:hypothetical protein